MVDFNNYDSIHC